VRVACRALGTGGARGSALAALGLLAGALVLAGPPLAAAAEPGPLNSGRVQRFAGNGLNGGFSGDGRPAVFAELAYPGGLAVDARGNVYIADTANARIRRVNAKGIIRTFAGGHGHRDTGDGGPASAAGLMGPRGVASDARGNVYVVGSSENPDDNTRVRVIDSAGKIRTFAGTATAGFSGDGGLATSAQLFHPQAVATDRYGNVYIAESLRIRKVDPAGVISTFAGTGVRGTAGDRGPATAAQFSAIAALATDAQGNVYVGDYARVRRIDRATGTITTVAGTAVLGFSGDGGPATSAQLSVEVGALAVDGHGVLYIADAANQRVRAVDGTGKITTIVGGKEDAYTGGWGGLGRSVGLVAPRGLAVDGRGRLLISSANYVWRFTRGLTPAALARCTRRSARQLVETRGLGFSSDNFDPVAQMFCGPFAGRGSTAMVVSLRLPSCGLSYYWLVYRLVDGKWKRALKHNGGAYLTRSGRRILEWNGVLGPHDAHCLPSSYRVRSWHWNGNRLVHGGWQRKAKGPKRLPGLRLRP
jgi:hypothetical protein